MLDIKNIAKQTFTLYEIKIIWKYATKAIQLYLPDNYGVVFTENNAAYLSNMK